MRLPEVKPCIDLGELEQIHSALLDYLCRESGEDVEIKHLQRCSAGFSWLTLSFDLAFPSHQKVADEPLILQIGPPNGLFAPYSARPQVLALNALRQAGLAVPEARWHSDEPDVFGAPFFVSRRVEGDTLVPWALKNTPAQDRVDLTRQFIDTLAAIHSFAWRDTGIALLDDGVTEENAALRQLEQWNAAIRLWSLRRYPMLDWAAQWLHDNAPAAPRVSVIHGDYRVGNFLCIDARITAILDWEMVHLGDPHEDVAWACLPMYNGGSQLLMDCATRQEVVERYEKISGIKLSVASLRFYEAFALYKGIAIAIGGACCFEQGRFRDLRMAAMGTQIASLLKQLYKTIEAPL